MDHIESFQTKASLFLVDLEENQTLEWGEPDI